MRMFSSTVKSSGCYRWEASRWALRRKEYFKYSQDAFEKGKGAVAAKFSKKGQEATRIMEMWNRKAATAEFKSNNSPFAERMHLDSVDLHGLYIEEALFCVEKTLEIALSRKQYKIIYITGNGLHSPNGEPKLKTSIAKYLKTYTKFSYLMDNPQKGAIRVNIS